MVNLAGISFDHRMTEDSGASVSDVARAFLASREIFGFSRDLEGDRRARQHVDLDTQISLFLDARRMAERGTVWLLRHRHPPLDIADAVDTFSAGLAFLCESLDDVVSGPRPPTIERPRERSASSRGSRSISPHARRVGRGCTPGSTSSRSRTPRRATSPMQPRRTGRCSMRSNSAGSGTA
jgi:NAD-specific glutamate dehydrogenase